MNNVFQQMLRDIKNCGSMPSRERCHSTDAPLGISETLYLNVNNIQFMIPKDQKNINSQ